MAIELSLGNLGKAKEAFDIFTSVADAADDLIKSDGVSEAITDIMSGIELDDAVKYFKQFGSEGDNLKKILLDCGFEIADVEKKLAGIGSSGVKGTGKLSTAFAGLAAKIGISTTALGVFIGVAAGIAAIAVGVNLYNQHIQECVDSAREAGSVWTDNNDTLQAQIDRVDELGKKLEKGNLTEEESYAIKSELYSIQQSLNESYGKQAEGIDLVNGNIEKQIELMGQLSAVEANEFLNENKKGIDKATKEMTKDRTFEIGRFMDISTSEVDTLKEIVDKYSDSLGLIDNDGDNGIGVSIIFKGDASEAEQVLNDLMTDLRSASAEFDNPTILNSVMNTASKKLVKMNEVLENYQDIYEQARQAELVADTSGYTYGDTEQTATKWLSDYSKAVEKYNAALESGDPEAIRVAAEEFGNVKTAVDSLTDGSMSKYADQVGEITDQLNEAAIAKNDFTNTLTQDGSLANSYAEYLKDIGVTDIELKASLDSAGVQKGEVAFKGILNVASQFGMEVDDVIDLLVELGYVSGGATDTVADGMSKITEEASKAASNTESLLSGITGVQSILSSQGTGESISVADFDTAALNGYSDALEYNNGALQLNAEKVTELVHAKVEEQIAHNDTAKALAQSEYLENAAQIEQLREKLAGLGDDDKNLRTEIESNIQSLLTENQTLSNTCTKYDLLSASLREATSAHQHWINSQNASQSGDMFDGALGAMQHINDTLNNSESDLYGRIGRTDYKAAVDFIVPDTIDKEDTTAVNSYLESISDLFTYDEGGNQTGLNIDNFCQRAVDAGLMVLNEAGTAYEIAGGKTMEDFANGMNLALPLVQAMFGELQEFGAKFDWADEANKTMGDLAVTATEAAEALRGIDGNENLKLNIDVSDIETTDAKIAALNSTIDEMVQHRDTIGLDPSEVEYCNQIIEYCVAQKNLLTAPDVMMVDTSVVEGSLGNAIGLLQQFVALQNEISLGNALEIDTSSAEADLASVASAIQGLDPNVAMALQIDTTSIDTISQSIANLDAEVIVKAGVDESAVIGFQQAEHDAEGTVTWDNNTSEVDAYSSAMKYAKGTVTWGNNTSNVRTHFTATGTVNWGNGGDQGVNGTAHASGTARASGDWGTAPGGNTLVGELGREIVVDPHTGKWYTVGDNGAEFVNIPKGAIIFNHEQSDSLLEKGYVTGRGSAYAAGTAMVTGSIPITGYWPGTGSGSGSGNYGGSGNYHENQNSNSESDIAEDAKNAFEEAYKYHQHLLAMEQEDLEHYLRWLEEAYQDAYRNGEIELEDYYKYEEEVFEGRKELFQDYLNDLEFKISELEKQDGTEGQIINLYLGMIQDIKNEIAQARARGLNDNDEYIQELIEQQRDYEDEIAEIREDATDDAKNAVEDLIDYRIKMLKQDLENERDALEDKKDALKDFYDEQKDMLQKAYDDEKIIEERNEKRKAKSDIEAELDQLKFDDSAWAQKRKLELEEELNAAQKDLDDFEKEQALDNTQNLLDALYEQQAAQIDAEIEEIEAKLNDPEALYNQALRDIQNNTQALYQEMVDYNAKYGDGNPETVKSMWDDAKSSLDAFIATFGQAYKDIILVASPGTSTSSGYASGTYNATPGKKRVDEEGAEWLFTSGDGTKYRVFSGGEKVLNAEATKFLYEFAMDRGNALTNMFSSLLSAVNLGNINRASVPIQFTTGDIIIQGNADMKTVSEIRRAQRENIDFVLKEFTKLNR